MQRRVYNEGLNDVEVGYNLYDIYNTGSLVREFAEEARREQEEIRLLEAAQHKSKAIQGAVIVTIVLILIVLAVWGGTELDEARNKQDQQRKFSNTVINSSTNPDTLMKEKCQNVEAAVARFEGIMDDELCVSTSTVFASLPFLLPI